MEIGQISWYNPDKGYGFITPERGDAIFVHRSSLLPGVEPLVHPGVAVSFERRVDRERRQQAIHVSICSR
jgi:CspA family cold shock protein